MQPIKSYCSQHSSQEVNMVCIERQCQKPVRLICPQCVQQQLHQNHKLITLKKYFQIKKQLQQIDPTYKKGIKAKLKMLQNKIKHLLQQIQDLIQQQFLSYDLYQKNFGQEQQFSGEISLAANDPLFIYAINGKTVQQLNKYCQYSSLALVAKIDQYQEDLIVRSHQFIELLHKLHNKDIQISKSKLFGRSVQHVKTPPGSQIKFSQQEQIKLQWNQQDEMKLKEKEKQKVKENEKQQMIQKIQKKQVQKNSTFFFSDLYKPQFFILSADKKSICRKTKAQFGLSMYGIVQNPLTKEFPEITFKLTQQPGHRFVYIGVCDVAKMKNSKYRGCYQLGGGMNSIRQSQPKKPGICLHNSNKQYSDKPIVGFDFTEGDTITLYINFEKQQLYFIKNINKQKFIMPIDTKQDWHPFVGLKYEGDRIEIVN